MSGSHDAAGRGETRRIAITGSRGYLGGRLLEALGPRGFEPVVLEADVTDAAALARAFAAAGPAFAVLHLAAMDETGAAKNPRAAIDVNGFGAQLAFKAAADAGARRFIYFSTFHVNGEVGDGRVVTEASVPNPLHPYALSKWVGEQLCRATARAVGTELAILRLANGLGAPARHGTRRSNLVLLDLCTEAQSKKTLTLRSAGLQRRDFVSVDDITQAVELVVSCPGERLRDPVFHVGSGVATEVRELARIVQKTYERLYDEQIPLYVPGATSQKDESFTFCIDKLRSLDFTPTTDLELEAQRTLRFFEYLRT